ncbi:hypothetical protein VP01_1960g8 [Puccinia sorghi]|uniref:Diphthamide biosynthesis protein 4 n=1 Tax=Puccinia sorghi TaxID=27349 RepID=A0A0L6VBX3_9BASI|nr:hypothetical protein VP01_1960g8 [Puccinia sorghi]
MRFAGFAGALVLGGSERRQVQTGPRKEVTGEQSQMVCSSSFSIQDERAGADYYKILQVTSDATPVELRTAYLRLIKLYHPDKLKQPAPHPSVPQPTHSRRSNDHRLAQELIDAYSTLKDPSRRKDYDLARLQSPPQGSQPSSSRSDTKIVSQVLDLSEFTQLENEGQGHAGEERFVFPCRCGGQFLIGEDLMEAGIDIIGCDGCSLAVKVEYQAA